MAKRGKKEENQNNESSKSGEQELPLRDVNMIFSIARRRQMANRADDINAGKGWRLKHHEEEILAILKRANITSLKLTPTGSNYTFLALLCDPESGAEYAAIYKPVRGEAPLWDFPNGTLYKREYASYIVTRALDWCFIPPTVIREGPHGVGTIQLFIDADESANLYDFRDFHTHEIQRITVFDLITNNADRKPGHFLLGLDGYIWGIDHGLCFNSVPKLRTVIWEYAGTPVPEDIITDMMELVTDSARVKKLKNELEELLDHREVEIFFRRMESLITSPFFPGITSRRQIPWGFF
jgi:uncharacterized repeat protein (TIGR03843 family)